MELLYKRCAGLDVHQKTVVACARVVDEGKVNEELRTFDTTTSGLLALSAWLEEKGCTHVAMEATGVYWKPVWHILEAKFQLVLANAAHIKNVPGRKTDVKDAAWIADLLAHGLIRGSFVPPTPIQDLRALMRTRKQLVREIARNTQRLPEGARGCEHQAHRRRQRRAGEERSSHPRCARGGRDGSRASR
jgi:transposase